MEEAPPATPPPAASHALPWSLPGRKAPGVDVRAAALLLSEASGGSLPVETAVVALAGAPGQPGRRALVVEVDGGELVAGLEGDLLVAELFLYVVGAGQELVTFAGRVAVCDLVRWRAPLARSGLKLAVPLELPEGTHTLRFLARRSDGERFALGSLPVVVTGETPDAVSWWPAIPDREGGWVQVAEPEGVEMDLPPSPEGREWRPGVRPVLSAAAPGPLYVVGEAVSPGTTMELIVLAPDGGVADQHTLVFQAAAPAGEDRGLRFASLPALEADPGPHTLRLSHPVLGARDLAVMLLEGTAEEPVVWAGLDAALLQAPAAGSGGLETGPFHALAVRRGYREALGELAAGRTDPALRALAALESATIGGGAGDVIDRLGTVQFRVVQGLVREQPEALVPVLHLHHQAQRAAAAAGASLRSAHGRLLAVRLAGLARAHEASRDAAADMLASFARDLQRGGATASADQLNQQALTLRSGHPAALLGLAAAAERAGDYATAVRLLDQLLKTDAPPPEVRLRLGVSLARLGERRRAIRELQRCLTAGPPWVRLVAIQELARVLVASRQSEAALVVLERGREVFPGDQSLVVLTARVLEAQGERVRSAVLLEEMRPDLGGPEGSPRWRYSQWPDEDVRAARQRLEQAAQRHLPALAGALGQGNR